MVAIAHACISEPNIMKKKNIIKLTEKAYLDCDLILETEMDSGICIAMRVTVRLNSDLPIPPYMQAACFAVAFS